MKVSKLIALLEEVRGRFGDIEVTGGSLVDDTPLRSVTVIDVDGHEVWPRNPNGIVGFKVDGVYFE